jgi:glycosyltransferase involved in cell wall biosynthesis
MIENPIAIVIPSYQNKEWCEKNLTSALNQNYSNFRIVYADDCSTDGTAEEVEIVKAEYDKDNKITLIRNTTRHRPLGNVYNMVHTCDDDEIVVILDGDDWFPHNEVLNRVNQEYNNGNVWMTYGQFISYPDNGPGCSCAIPKEIINAGAYRRYQWCSSHLRTYYAWLFKKIKKEDLMHNGEWIKMAGDLAAAFPLLEMAGLNQSFIPDILYVYNYQTPINEAKVNRSLQIEFERIIRSKPPYQRIMERQ